MQLTRIFAGIHQKRSRGFTIIELTIALSIALVSVMGAFAITVAMGKHHKGTAVTVDMYRESRIAIEKMFKEISETSDETITIGYNAISFASARDGNGVFQLKPHQGIFDSHRPDWQKAIIYYQLEEDRKLYRKEVAKSDWTTNYEALEPGDLQRLGGYVMARNVSSLNFNPVYGGSASRYRILNATLEFSQTREKVQVGAIPAGVVSTRIPLMNRES